MNLRTSFDRLLNSLVAKPAPRRGWRAAVVLESLELRLNLSAVLIVETVDAYWLYDDFDSLVAAATDGQATSSTQSDPSSDFTPQELQVIDGLVTELIASEGYDDSDILAITYVDDTTSDELIANGYFEDGFFDDGAATDALANLAERADLAEMTDAQFDFEIGSPELTGAAGNDSILANASNATIPVIVPVSENLNPLVANAVLPVIEAASGTDLVDQLGSLVREAETHTDFNAVASVTTRHDKIAEARTTFSPRLAVTAETAALSAVVRMANSPEWILTFAKFPSAVLASAGIASSLEYTSYLWSQHRASNADDSTNLEADDAGQFSYSQIAAAFGASGLAIARWLDSEKGSENALPVKQPRRRGRGTRQTSL